MSIFTIKIMSADNPTNATVTKDSLPEALSTGLDDSVQSVAHLTDDLEVHRFDSRWVQQHVSWRLIMKIIFSTIILTPPLIQEGQLSVSGERMCTSTG